VGLDRGTAALLFRAERLQEKGQLRQALKYYEAVLSTFPDCPEAVVNARITRDLLAEDKGEKTRRQICQ